jgi:hypothetical protein
VRRDEPNVWADLVDLVPLLDAVEARHTHGAVPETTRKQLDEFLADEQRVGIEGVPARSHARHRRVT